MYGELNIGPLTIGFVTEFELVWNDKGSGGQFDSAYYRPKTPEGFYALGHYGQKNHSAPKGSIMVVKANPGYEDALAFPCRYDMIWKDKGSGADKDGSFWKPIPPSDNYVALGTVCCRGYSFHHSYDEVVCINRKYVVEGKLGEQVWLDTKTGADKDFGSWKIDPPQITPFGIYSYIPSGSFIGVTSHNKPTFNDSCYCLKVVFPSTEKKDDVMIPKLTGFIAPPAETMPYLSTSVKIPFVCIKDPDLDFERQSRESPVYTLERLEFYTKLHFMDNRGVEEPQPWEYSETVGVTESITKTMRESYGVSVTCESGIEFPGVGSFKTSITVSTELGFETSQSFSHMKENTTTFSLITPAQKAAAIWVKTNRFVLRRADKVIVTSWDIKTDDTVSSQYPAIY